LYTKTDNPELIKIATLSSELCTVKKIYRIPVFFLPKLSETGKRTEAVFLNILLIPGIDSKELIPPAYALAGWSPYL